MQQIFGKTVFDRNAHAMIPDKKTVQDRLRRFRTRNPNYRPISVLLIAIDSISRMNLKRSMPKTAKYLHDNDWIELRGYNKVIHNYKEIYTSAIWF